MSLGITGIDHVQMSVPRVLEADCLAFYRTYYAPNNASLIVVHTWQAPLMREQPDPGCDQDSVLPPTADEIQENVARQLEQPLATWLAKYPGVTASVDVVHGHPGRVLAGLSARADLVVLGRHGTGRAVHAVLSHAHGPVAIVPSA